MCIGCVAWCNYVVARERCSMKQATGTNKTKTLTLDKIGTRKLTKRQRDEMSALAALPDDRIDLSNIPEITATSDWVRNPLYRPITRSITIRLNARDIVVAQALSKSKGLPYQTYIKQLLHTALERELSAVRR
jgi:predicted DNA binding CopG/RHH family protein